MAQDARIHRAVCTNLGCDVDLRKEWIAPTPDFCPFCGSPVITNCPHCKKDLPEIGRGKKPPSFCPFRGDRLRFHPDAAM
jgi:hypothetical protein